MVGLKKFCENCLSQMKIKIYTMKKVAYFRRLLEVGTSKHFFTNCAWTFVANKLFTKEQSVNALKKS